MSEKTVIRSSNLLDYTYFESNQIFLSQNVEFNNFDYLVLLECAV